MGYCEDTTLSWRAAQLCLHCNPMEGWAASWELVPLWLVAWRVGPKWSRLVLSVLGCVPRPGWWGGEG